MKALKLNNIEKQFFSFLDISKILGISPESARVVAHRYVRNGILVRIKPNIFVLSEKWKYFSMENRFETANLLQVPSYVSLTTALAYYDITTQIQREYIECISIKRSLVKQIKDVTFCYAKLSEKLYCAFEKKNGFYIALPEKALLDAVYLTSLGRYSLDVPALSLSSLNQEVLINLAELYPESTKKILRVHGFISQA
jgi:predicted transcriptional regulator of viral defense system